MKDQSNKHFWQWVAKLYAPFMKSAGPLYDEICVRCRPYLTKDMDVLELACGSGQLSFRLAESVRMGSDGLCGENDRGSEKTPRPTFIWGTDARQQFSECLMALAGFRVHHRWNAWEFADYVERRGFTMLERETMGGSIRPLCCLIAHKREEERIL